MSSKKPAVLILNEDNSKLGTDESSSDEHSRQKRQLILELLQNYDGTIWMTGFEGTTNKNFKKGFI